MSVKERLKKFIASECIAINEFEKGIGVANGYVNSISKSIGIDKINTIIEKYPNLSLEWLFSGNGDMLKLNSSKNYMQDKPTNVVAEPSNTYGEHILSIENEALKRENKLLRNENKRLIEDINLKNELIEAFRTGKIVIHATPSEDKGTA